MGEIWEVLKFFSKKIAIVLTLCDIVLYAFILYWYFLEMELHAIILSSIDELEITGKNLALWFAVFIPIVSSGIILLKLYVFVLVLEMELAPGRTLNIATCLIFISLPIITICLPGFVFADVRVLLIYKTATKWRLTVFYLQDFENESTWFLVYQGASALVQALAYHYQLKKQSLHSVEPNSFELADVHNGILPKDFITTETSYQLRKGLHLDDIQTSMEKVFVFVLEDVWNIIVEALKHVSVDTVVVTEWDGVADKRKKVDVESLDPAIKLQILTRNERYNVTGAHNPKLYKNIEESTVNGLKCLVKMCVLASRSLGVAYGGYGGSPNIIPQLLPVGILDLSALQFQRFGNNGNICLILKDNNQKGFSEQYSNEMYRILTGEEKPTFTSVNENDRFIKFKNTAAFGDLFFDLACYKHSIAHDFVLAGFAANQLAQAGKVITIRFLKFGSGFFAGCFKNIIEDNILEGVLMGIELLFGKAFPTSNVQSSIKYVDLPFYENLHPKWVHFLEKTYQIQITFSLHDALQSPPNDSFLVTTNCGDPHAMFGNEMGRGSVDACIASNLSDEGRRFSPIINTNFEVCKIKLGRQLFN